MRVSFQPSRSLQKLPDSELIQLVTRLDAFPEVLVEVYWEVCERRFAGWDRLLSSVETLFIKARRAELEDEVEVLHERRDEALAADQARAAAGAPVMPPTRSPRPVTPSVVSTPELPPSLPSQPPVARPEPPAPKATTPAVARPASSSPTPAPHAPRSWAETARLVRHATASEPRADLDAEDWAAESPLKLLGYTVGMNGLSDMHREQFLADFVRKAVLPTTLPRQYLDEWGTPGSAARLRRTARHIAFQKLLRERNDATRYRRAIECWDADLDFLQRYFADTFSAYEWASIRREG